MGLGTVPELDPVTELYACLYYEVHFVLVRVSSNTLLVFDSLKQHAPRAAMDNLNRFAETLKLSHERYHGLQVTYLDCVQQAPGDNDCALHVVNNLYMNLFSSDTPVISRKTAKESWYP